MKLVDLTGREFGTLTVQHRHIVAGDKRTYWWCKCACGVEKPVWAPNLKRPNVTCGCGKTERIRKVSLKHGHSVGYKKSRTYRCWVNMLSRCGNQAVWQYKYYGGRGIKVCDRWRESFENFLADMGECPPGMTIEREKNDLDYEPDNCRWATKAEQNLNKRNNRRLTLNGVTKTLVEWAGVLGCKPYVLSGRLRQGWSEERTLTQPVRRHGARA